MLKAMDADENIVWADDAQKGMPYFCPVCEQEVTLRIGNINIPHFAHRSGECTDDWTYDMSEWHKRMQSYFPEESREVVLTHNGETHRADVLQDGVVVEFQHSRISEPEFCARNRFYSKLGLKVVWVIDLEDLYEEEQIYYKDEFFRHMRWLYAYKYLQSVVPQRDFPNVAIWLYLRPADDDDGDGEEIVRVVWAIENGNCADYSHVFVDSNNILYMKKNMSADAFVKSPLDRWKEYITKHKQYSLKNSGIKGKPKTSYICPLTNDWISAWHACSYCKHNGGMFCRKRKGHSSAVVACIYPEIDPATEGEKRFDG